MAPSFVLYGNLTQFLQPFESLLFWTLNKQETDKIIPINVKEQVLD